MFRKAQLSLTIVYSLLFLGLFWLFSFGLYEWMNVSFGEGYITQVEQRQGFDSDAVISKNAKVVTVAGDVALDQLLHILIILNSILLITIPVVSWFLAKRTLSPIKNMHEKQKQFVSDASHELQTPITIMTSEIELALRKSKSEREYKHILENNLGELKNISELIDGLLFLSRSDQQGNISGITVVDVTDLLTNILMRLKPIYSQKKLSVFFTPPETSVQIKGNEMLLRQLFFNLIDNAIKYTFKGYITIEVIENAKFITVKIIDTGIGIEKKYQEKLFDRFFRVDQARTVQKGYGIGLSIAQSIIEKHKGKITVVSELHKGSTFIVTLPKE